ncbi:uncharacterized protein At3g49140 isoform X2 [Telopea speciosissima]|uniref:uncharacterized protein At3g49140 isoform X2 n=1 Tax=Telopea speciosissima TaxID=54955 RepID=UPI001CC82E0A|nr:uncharacterized protein At3g49140 isoform X2 [Telopea speciosissima]
MVIASPSSVPIGPVYCQFCQIEDICSSGATSSWMRCPLDGRRALDLASIRYRSPFFGSGKSNWLSAGKDVCPSKVWVAADYSDSVPDSSNYMGDRGYHPLEEVKVSRRSTEIMLTSAEIARTTVEANSNALLLFPGMVHCEPHEQISWAEFHYIIDDYGDLFFEIFDDENIFQDPGASNPVNVLIGMDISMYTNRRVDGNYNNISDRGSDADIPFNDDLFEAIDPDALDILVDWRMLDINNGVHPLYFAKTLTKAVNTKYSENMDRPSNGLSIIGCLRPAFSDEESYLRRLSHNGDGDGYASDWKDGESLNFNSESAGANIFSTLYKMEIMQIELFSVYGVQSSISLQHFQDAEPDILVHSVSEIIERFNEKGMKYNAALKSFCRKKGLNVEGANLIGVDSLGMDVRVFSGAETQTLRFSFKSRVTSGRAAEKKIQQMLFPRFQRKRFKPLDDGLKNPDSF